MIVVTFVSSFGMKLRYRALYCSKHANRHLSHAIESPVYYRARGWGYCDFS